MQIPEKIQVAAERLKAGHRVNRLTVRDFLRHFGTERRGAVKVEEIRAILDSLDLRTEPEFDAVWIDAPIWLKLKEGTPVFAQFVGTEPPPVEDSVLDSTPSSVHDAEEQVQAAPMSADEQDVDTTETNPSLSGEDPTFRIGNLPAANQRLIVVGQEDPLSKAVTLMLQYDFAQLPVMRGEREVKGVVTWKSIAVRKALECKCEHIKDCSEEPRIIDSNRTLFDAIPTIVEHGYVLVRDQRDRRITGIVTASDLSLQFQLLAEPFLLIREVELHVRQLLAPGVTSSDIAQLLGGTLSQQGPKLFTDLSFGQYVRLFQLPQIWEKLALRIDKNVFIELLESVRLIRNDVMHFDPDPMSIEEMSVLKRASSLMQSLYEILD